MIREMKKESFLPTPRFRVSSSAVEDCDTPLSPGEKMKIEVCSKGQTALTFPLLLICFKKRGHAAAESG